MKRKKLIIGVCVLVGILGFSIYVSEKKKEENNFPQVNEAYLSFFKESCTYEEIITYAEEDINNDNEKDLIIVYKKNKNNNEAIAVVSDKKGCYTTTPILAPKEDVNITFRDIDEKDEMEVMISGSKNGNIGYAIFRLENKKLIDLFGEGMDACC